MPISARLPTVHPCKLAWWPIVTLSPMTVSAEWPVRKVPAVRMTHPSCTLLRSPMLMLPQSAAEAAPQGAGDQHGTAQDAQTFCCRSTRVFGSQRCRLRQAAPASAHARPPPPWRSPLTTLP